MGQRTRNRIEKMATFANIGLRSIMRTTALRVPSRGLSTTSVSLGGHKGHSRLENWEAIQFEKGNYDPYFLKPVVRHAKEAYCEGTKENPNIIIIDNWEDNRMVGCICNEEDTNVKFFHVFEGEPRRCACGHWFKAERRNPYVEEFTPEEQAEIGAKLGEQFDGLYDFDNRVEELMAGRTAHLEEEAKARLEQGK